MATITTRDPKSPKLYRIDYSKIGLPQPKPGKYGTYPGQVRYWDKEKI